MFSSSGLASCQESGSAIIFGADDGFFNRNAFCAGDGGPAGRERVAGDHEVVGDGAALDFIFRAPGAVGIDFAFLVAIFLRDRCRSEWRPRLRAAR